MAIVLLAAAGAARGQSQPDRPSFPGSQQPRREARGNKLINAEVLTSLTQAAPGDEFYIAVRLTIDEGWVFYSPDPGDVATPAAMTAQGEGLEIDPPLWQPDHPHTTDMGGGEILVNNVYERETVVYLPVRVLPGGKTGEAVLSVTVSGQLCSDTSFQCLPVGRTVSALVRIADESSANPAWAGPLAAGLDEALTEDQLRALHGAQPAVAAAPGVAVNPDVADWAIWTGLGMALLAGLILNVMPCVLPVIPIRIMSIVDAAGGSRRRFVSLGLAFAVGIVLFFAGLGVVNVVLRLATQGVLDWGRHFQLRSFRIGLAMLMVVLACNLFGLFNVLVPRKIMAMDSGVSARTGGHPGAVGMGLMMAILATPCSFALLMSVLGWASVKPIWLGTLAIVLMGVGMAAPHALLTAFPTLVAKLPKPGRWMELLKQGMGFAVLAVAALLIGTLSETFYVMKVTCFGVILAFALWMWGVWVRYDAPLSRKLAVRGAAAAMVLIAGLALLPAPRPLAVEFEPFSDDRIAEARADDKIVLVKFSATWCGSCIIIDQLIYNDPAVARELLDRGIVAIKGDVSNPGAPAEGLLYDRLQGAPPLTVVYPPGDGPPIRLPGKFSHADLTAALDQAAGQ